jgi:hypothetical protein
MASCWSISKQALHNDIIVDHFMMLLNPLETAATSPTIQNDYRKLQAH